MKSTFFRLFLLTTLTFTSANDKLLVVSFDGFRHDYLNQKLTPYLTSLKSTSSFAKSLLNVFPTQTFVNHFTIATGLYSEVHCVIGRSVYDQNSGRILNYGYDLFHYNMDIIPIWTLNQKEGKGRHSGVMMWPGSQFSYGGTNPTFLTTFNETLPWESRVSTAVSWFLHTKTPANLVMMYFEEPDAEEHASGPAPDSQQTRERLKKVDKIVEVIIKKLKDNSLTDVNMVLLSDHGMESITLDRLIDLNKIVGGIADMYGSSPILQIYPKKGKSISEVYNKLKESATKNKNFKVYLKPDIPDSFHIKSCGRTPPILAVAEPKYAFQDYKEDIAWQIKHNGASKSGVYGIHGYDPSNNNMKPFFLAHGPMFKHNYATGELKIIDMFSLFAHVLKLQMPTLKPNGTLDGVKEILK